MENANVVLGHLKAIDTTDMIPHVVCISNIRIKLNGQQVAS